MKNYKMKNWILFLTFFICIFCNADAQYKKATFLNAEGRFYGIGTTSRLLGGGNKPALGIYINLGRERFNRRIFTGYQLEYVKGSAFKYVSPIYGGTSTTIPLVMQQYLAKLSATLY